MFLIVILMRSYSCFGWVTARGHASHGDRLSKASQLGLLCCSRPKVNEDVFTGSSPKIICCFKGKGVELSPNTMRNVVCKTEAHVTSCL